MGISIIFSIIPLILLKSLPLYVNYGAKEVSFKIDQRNTAKATII